MVWGTFYASGKTDLVLMERKQSPVRYINVSEKSLPIYESFRCH